MIRPIHLIAAAAVLLVVAAVGCPTNFSSPAGLTSPTSTSSSPPSAAAPMTMAAVAGRWTLATVPTGAAAETGCTTFDYSVTPAGDGGSAVVRFTAVCPTFQVTGGGAAILSGSRLAWNASGNATRGTISCPFDFTRSTASLDADGIRVTFTGTVCGLPVNGSERLRRSN